MGGGGGGFRSPQKMAKAVKKKLRKFWSRKKNKKKNKTGDGEEDRDREHEHFLDPTWPLSLSLTTHSQTHYHYVHSRCCEPSAPPMPPWLEMELEFDPEPDAPIVPPRASDLPSCSARMREEIVVETTTSSYQQYLDPNPVYGVPVKPVSGDFVGAQRSELLLKFFGFLGCLCPCFRIGEEEAAKQSC